MRGAPSLDIIRALQDYGAKVRAYDPHGMKAASALLSGVQFTGDPYLAAAGADALVLVTHWSEFRNLDLLRLKSLMAAPVLVDLRNFWDPEIVSKHGFSPVSIGRPPLLQPRQGMSGASVSAAYAGSIVPLLTLPKRRARDVPLPRREDSGPRAVAAAG